MAKRFVEHDVDVQLPAGMGGPATVVRTRCGGHASRARGFPTAFYAALVALDDQPCAIALGCSTAERLNLGLSAVSQPTSAGGAF